jgi:hypothetical protein
MDKKNDLSLNDLKLYRRSTIQRKTGMSSGSIFRWAKRLEGTRLIASINGVFFYTQDAFDILAFRAGQQGHKDLPDGETIESLVSAWNATGTRAHVVINKDSEAALVSRIQEVAGIIDLPPAAALFRLKQIGKVRNAEDQR